MLQVRSTPRYAHAEGHTNLTFSASGNYVITCGSEGDVRIWNGVDDDDPKAVCAGEKAFAVAQKGDKLYVGSDHNYVQIFTFPDAELDGILTRFTAPVNTLDISPDGSIVAAGSSDMEIHIVDVSTSVIKYFSGHKAPILHVAIDPKMEYLGSSSCDGTVRVWKIEDQTVAKEWADVIKPSNSFHNSESLCQLTWEPMTGRLFAIPFTSEIKVMQRSTWNVMMTFSDSQSPKKYSLSAWSSCGRFLAGSTLNGEIIVWNTMVSRLVSSSLSDNNVNICCLRWHPQSDSRQIAFCDVNGQLVMVDNCYPSSKESTVDKEDKPKSVEEPSLFDDVQRDDYFTDDDNDPEAISLEKIKSGYNSLIEGDDASEKGDDDLGSVKSYSTHGPMMPLVELQPAFQPTSTPAHLQRRFMVFNDIGYVRQTNTEEENMIDVDFHDASIHHAFRINNLLNHTMAALNSEALVLACEKFEDGSSKLVCRLFNSWDSFKEWNTEMPEDENIEAIAVGAKWVAVATNLRYLRLFTLSGVQRDILCLRGPVVCMNASGDLLFVVYHSSMGLPGEQSLSFSVYEVSFDVSVLVAAQPLPLTPKTTLKWVGFSDQLNPCLLDSAGILKLFGSRSGFWKPICSVDAQGKEQSNHYFVIGVSEERQDIRCILCKGSYYPSTTPHPFITEIPWQIPVCEPTIDKGVMEEKFWRCNIAKECLSKENRALEKELIATALKFFALSCKTHHEMRVVDLCNIANNADVTKYALKYASKINHERLVDKLSDLQSEQQMRFSEPCNSEYEVRSAEHVSSYSREQYERNEKRTDSEDYQSQELFPERNSYEANSMASQESVSLIAETKKKRNANELRPVLPSRKVNPFKKASQLDSPSLVAATSSNEDQPTQSTANKKDIPNFIQYFKSELKNKGQDVPGTDASKLIEAAKEKYKLLKAANQSSVSDKTDPEIQEERDMRVENASKKRKSGEDEPVANTVENNVPKKKSCSKLQEFVFKKQT